MCLKADVATDKTNLENSILQQCEDLHKIFREGKLEEKLEVFELIKQQGYNMNDLKTRNLTGLSKEDYQYILNNYNKLMLKFSNVTQRVKARLNYINSAHIAKTIAIYGCKNCIGIVSRKLDVKTDDLCNNCKSILTKQQIIV